MKLINSIISFILKNDMTKENKRAPRNWTITFHEKININDDIDHSLKKYTETYKLLEEYDKKSPENPELLADAGRLRGFISNLQRHSRARGTYSSVQ